MIGFRGPGEGATPAIRRAEMVARLTAGRAHYERRELADA